MHIAAINCGSTKFPHIVEMLVEAGCEVAVYQMDGDLTDLEEHDGLVISGAPILLTETDPRPYMRIFKFLMNYPNPILGICFGHQVLGLINGAQVKRTTEVRVDQEIDVIDESALLDGIEAPFIFNQDHCEGITLPFRFKRVALTKGCEVEMMEHTNKPWFGVQFHPETSGEAGQQLFINFCKTCEPRM